MTRLAAQPNDIQFPALSGSEAPLVHEWLLSILKPPSTPRPFFGLVGAFSQLTRGFFKHKGNEVANA